MINGSAAGLYDFIAHDLIQFAQRDGLVKPDGGTAASGGAADGDLHLPPIGFCFSFPMKQSSLNKCVLMRCTPAHYAVTAMAGCLLHALRTAAERGGCCAGLRVTLTMMLRHAISLRVLMLHMHGRGYLGCQGVSVLILVLLEWTPSLVLTAVGGVGAEHC